MGGTPVDDSTVTRADAAAGELRPPASARPVTLADVAREAGTSHSTASRALSGRGYVSPGARARLVAAAERLGYVPNASARTLKLRTSRIVGVVVANLDDERHTRLAAGVDEALRSADYQVFVLADDRERAHAVAGAPIFVAMRAAGVVVTPIGYDAATLLLRNGIHVVEVGRHRAELPCDAVVADRERGARDATAHLLGRGHARIGLVIAQSEWVRDGDAVRGYRAAHRDAGGHADDVLVLPVPDGEAGAGARVGALLDDASPTAIVAGDGALAEEAWRAARARSLHVPRDLSLVALADAPWMARVDPALTAVAQPERELGGRAAELLLWRLEHPTAPPRVESVCPSLVVRESTARAAARA